LWLDYDFTEFFLRGEKHLFGITIQKLFIINLLIILQEKRKAITFQPLSIPIMNPPCRVRGY